MNGDAILGILTVLAALGAVVGLTLWSRRTINWIASSRAGSAREILKQRHGR